MPCNLIVVERANAARSELPDLIAAAGPFQVQVVPSVHAARQHLGQGACDVAILDLDFCSITAYATIADLAFSAPHIPMVVISDVIDDAQMRAALRAGAHEILPREQVGDLLNNAVRQAVQRSQATLDTVSLPLHDELVRQLRAASGAYAAALFILADDGQTLRELASVGYGPSLMERFRVMPLTAPVPLAEAVRNQKSLFLSKEAWDRLYPQMANELQPESRAWVTLPMVVGSKATGGVVLSYDMPHAFSAEERALIGTLVRDLTNRLDDGTHATVSTAQAAVPSERQLQSVLDATRDCIKVIDRDGIVLQMNRSGEELLGYDAEQVIGYSVEQFILPESRANVRACLQRAFEGDVVDCELKVLTHDRRILELQSRVVPLRNTAGDTEAVLAVTRDMTADIRAHEALADSERHFRNLVENLSDGVLEVDENATILYINQMSQTILGYRPDEMIGRAGWLFVHPDDVPGLRESLIERIGGIESNGLNEVRMRHRDGSWRILQLRARRYDTPQRAGVRLLITARDVTEERRIEQDLQHTREQLLQAQKLDAIGRLAGGIAHDFNNLLTAIGGHTDLLIDGLQPQHPMYGDLREIRVAVERAATLTRQLLAFSRKQVLQTTIIDLRELVRDTHNMLRRLIGEGIVIDLSLPEEPAQVRADYTQLQQVLVNLAVNARDALPRGGHISISVTLDRSRRASRVRLRVADNGTGMDRETQQRIFEPFFTTKEAGKGTGLGLPTVYGIVQQSGGQIEVVSEPGAGSTFDVYLPAVEGVPVPRPRTPKDTVPEPGHETILLVEDEAAVREVTARMLRRGGYSVLEAGHPDQAIDVVKNSKDITMIVTDVGLPGLTGPEMIEHMLDIRPDVKVLFTSGYTNDEIFAEGRVASRFAFLEKPFTARALLASVRSVLDN
jgi:two-component system, cell cycle sensor histidine kinase and response regulator CckA